MMRSLILLFTTVFFLTSCQKNTQKEERVPYSTTMQSQMQPAASFGEVSLGDIVPNELVCMVNNDYMGTEQLEVEVNGKIYYGCCEMCQQRLPVDESVRVAIDPISQKEVDKADAVIAVTGERGEVTYFENKENYQQYVETLLK